MYIYICYIITNLYILIIQINVSNELRATQVKKVEYYSPLVLISLEIMAIIYVYVYVILMTLRSSQRTTQRETPRDSVINNIRKVYSAIFTLRITHLHFSSFFSRHDGARKPLALPLALLNYCCSGWSIQRGRIIRQI